MGFKWVLSGGMELRTDCYHLKLFESVPFDKLTLIEAATLGQLLAIRL